MLSFAIETNKLIISICFLVPRWISCNISCTLYGLTISVISLHFTTLLSSLGINHNIFLFCQMFNVLFCLVFCPCFKLVSNILDLLQKIKQFEVIRIITILQRASFNSLLNSVLQNALKRFPNRIDIIGLIFSLTIWFKKTINDFGKITKHLQLIS